MTAAERPCQVCGLYAPSEELRPWSYQERLRVFRGPARARPDETSGAVYREELMTHVEYVCDRCAEALAAGASPSALRRRRAVVQMALLCAVLALIVLLTPILLPIFMSALWLR